MGLKFRFVVSLLDRMEGASLQRAAFEILLLLALYFPVGAADMTRIPAGAFTMGSDAGPEDERPAHRVTLAAFEIDLFPVTNADFAQFLNAVGPRNPRGERRYDDDDLDARIHRAAQASGPWQADVGFERHPVVEVTWLGGRDYCAWLGKRLPTEAEWEKAARGTDPRTFPWGVEQPTARRARYAAGYNQTSVVDAFPDGRSPYGVWDLAGNAWEWVSSIYRPYPYRDDDGRENLEAGPVRSTRGGGHDSPASEITATQRGRTLSRAPQAGHHNIGFRCAR
jgi:formylglycine-generating enzyme required for sulfatase activity